MRSFQLLILFAVITALLAFVAPSAKPAEDALDVTDQEVAPPSELALLMRAMAIHADSVKAGMGTKKDLPPYPKAFRELATASPTPGMHIDGITFPTFSKDYLAKLELLYKAKRADRPKAYNALVQSCANCHGTHCPGPLMRIKKMYAKGGE